MLNAKFDDNLGRAAIAMQLKGRTAIINAAGEAMKQTTGVTPFKKGELRTKRRIVPKPNGAQAQWQARHAGVQNAGQARGRTFRNYTTPGTGKEFVQKFLQAFGNVVLRYFK